MGLIACGLVLVTTRDDDCARCEGRERAGRLRDTMGLLALAGIAIFCGNELQSLYDDCPKSLSTGRTVLSVFATQFDHLAAVHVVLVTGIALATIALIRRCMSSWRIGDRLAGLIGLFAAASTIVVMHLTFPASIYQRDVMAYFLFLYVISVPTLLLLAVASLFLLTRPRSIPWADDLVEPPLCMACGYNLTGNASGRCPECGTLLVETLMSRPEPQTLADANHTPARRPTGIAWACCAFGLFWLTITIVRHCDPWANAILQRFQSLETWVLFEEWGHPPRMYSVLDIGISVAATICAFSLRNRRSWAAQACWIWGAAAILMSIWNAWAFGVGFRYLLNTIPIPSKHVDPLAFRAVFERNALAAGFPLFLLLYLAQRRVRHHMATWHTSRRNTT